MKREPGVLEEADMNLAEYEGAFYARLSKLHRAHGNIEQADRYFLKAVEFDGATARSIDPEGVGA